VALARRHHTAVVHGDAMYVYGGRSGSTAKADFWQYEFATSTWTAMPTHSAMPARFGHVAAVAEGKMYVFGGYVLADDAGLSSDATVWEYDFAAMTWSKLIPRVDNTADVLGSPLFPQSMPTARFAAAGAATGSSTGLYVVGGASASMETEYTFWKLDLATKAWTLLETSELVGRYDAASTLSTDGGRLVIYGGLRGGEFLDDVVVLFVGDAGL
jgi:N-acetylneuraminic acid mutarotase